MAELLWLCHFFSRKVFNMLRKMLLWILFSGLLLVTGCSKITTENYDQLRVGMDYNEVISFLGKADECDGAIGLKNCKWGDDKKYINVSFAGDKVVVFSGHGL